MSAPSSLGIRPGIQLAAAQVLRRWSKGIQAPRTEAGQSILSINVHCATPADPLSTASPKGEGGIDLILDPDEGVENHGPRFVQIKSVALHSRLLRRLVGIPSVYLEGLRARGSFLWRARLRYIICNLGKCANKSSRAQRQSQGPR